jgi:hypothetical protein
MKHNQIINQSDILWYSDVYDLSFSLSIVFNGDRRYSILFDEYEIYFTSETGFSIFSRVHLILHWENLGIFSQSQLRIYMYLVKSQYNTFRGVNWKTLRLSKVLLQFKEKGGDDCFDVMHDFVDKLS